MLYLVAFVLLVLWMLGLVTSHTIGGLILVLLVTSFVIIILRVIGGRNTI
jgi:hypothetical protein